MEFSNIAIIGDGAMASVLAMILCEKNIKTRMWGHDADQLEKIKQAGENVIYLPGYKLPEDLEYQPDDSKIMAGADLIVSAVPSQFIRPVWKRLKPFFPKDVPIVTVAKGIENETLMRPDEILADILGGDISVAVLSGPTIADELARKLPATACAASVDQNLAEKVQHTFNTNSFRVYTNTDIIGVELAGAMKNVIAIAAGVLDGIGAGDNAKAALLSRGLTEISRFGIALGARPETFAGLTGMGDLVTTCFSPTGRNRSFGERIGKGQSVEEATNATTSVIEGIATCRSVSELARKHNVEMPITQAVYEVLFRGKSVQQAISDLMSRKLKPEIN